MYLPDMPWSVPVHVTFQNGTSRAFSSVFEALDILENEWPRRSGPRYLTAVETCRRTLQRMMPIAVAREAFIAACLEANLLAARAGDHHVGSAQGRENQQAA